MDFPPPNPTNKKILYIKGISFIFFYYFVSESANIYYIKSVYT